MSRLELLTRIENLRSEMNMLAAAGAEYGEILKISQELDKYIFLYQKAMV